MSETMTLFRDDGNENTAGYIKNLKMWNVALDQADVVSKCGCVLADYGAECEHTIALNPVYGAVQFSSVWANDPTGRGHGQGRLNSPQAWSAGANSAGQWFQVVVQIFLFRLSFVSSYIYCSFRLMYPKLYQSPA
jgi:hypothetical protein